MKNEYSTKKIVGRPDLIFEKCQAEKQIWKRKIVK